MIRGRWPQGTEVQGDAACIGSGVTGKRGLLERFGEGGAAIPADQRWEADQERHQPNDKDHHLCSTRRHQRPVLDGTRDCEVSIHGNGTQVQDGSGAHPHIDDEPALAPDLPKDPHI